MEQTLTQSQLYDALHQVKTRLDDYKEEHQNNVIFFDSQSLYCFLSTLCCKNGETIGTILKKLEHCIPFALTDDSFSLFLSSYQTDNQEKMERLRKGFIESCKKDFLFHLYYISEQKQWQRLLDTCEVLRQKKRCL